jgi:PAS domain S-box-containing protein
MSLGWIIGGTLAIAASLELFGRYLFWAYGVGYGVTGVLTLLAMAFWAASAVYVIRRAHGVPRVTWTLCIGACAIVFSQAVSMGRYFAPPGVTFLMQAAQPLLEVLEEGGFVAGLALVFAGFYLSILEADKANTRVRRERQALAGEVAERSRTEAALRESEQRFRQLAEGIRETFWIIDHATGQILYISPAYEEIWGLRSRDLLADPNSSFEAVHADDKGRIMRVLETHDYRMPLELVYRIVRPDGDARWIRSRLFPVFDEKGEVCRSVGIAEDITEHKETEAALRKAYADTEERVQERTASLSDVNRKLREEIAERQKFEQALQGSETRYRTLAEASQDVIFIVNRDDTVQYANSFAGRQVSRMPEDIIGRRRADLFPPEIEQDQRKHLEHVFTSGQPLRVEAPTQFQDRLGWQDTHLIPLKDSAGNVTAVLGVSRDITDRKRTEEALRASQERYRSLIEQASDVVWRIDTQGRLTFVSPVAERLVGYKPEELLGKSFQITLDKESARESQAILRKRLAGEFGTHSMRLEVAYRRKDGSVFPGEVVTSPIFDPAGNLIEVQGITRDITERKRAQEALQRRMAIEELVATISTRFINASSDEIDAEIMGTVKALGKFLEVDRTFVRLFSADRSTFARDYEWFAEGLQPRSLSALRLSLGSFEWSVGKLMQGENVVVPRMIDLPPEASEDKALWVAMGIASIVCVPLVIGDSVGGFFGLTSERTARVPEEEDIRLMRLVAGTVSNALLHQRFEDALRKSEERHRSLIEGLSEAVYRMSLPDGKYEYMGSAARLVFGYPAEHFMSRPRCIHEIVHPDSAAHLEEMWNGLLRGETPSAYEYKIIDPEGKERWILQSNRLIRNEAGLSVAVEGICRNNTQERVAHQLIEEQREKFLESAKMSVLGEMASNVAHEINNPLAIVSGSAEQLRNLLDRDPIPPLKGGRGDVVVEHVPRLTESIMRNVSRIQTIVNGLRTFAREGEHDPFQGTPVKSIVEDTVVLCQDWFASHHVALTIEEIPEDLTIECRATQIMEVLFNLLSNALHAVENSSEKWVNITARDDGAEAVLSVTDSGLGVPPEIVKRMFERFVTSKEFGRGIGLGLSISKRIVLTHNGTLSLDMACRNTRFVIRLPKRQPAQAEQGVVKVGAVSPKPAPGMTGEK